jgi:hypothetical protein
MAKRIFMDKHPLAKDKAQAAMLKSEALRPGGVPYESHMLCGISEPPHVASFRDPWVQEWMKVRGFSHSVPHKTAELFTHVRPLLQSRLSTR